MIERQTLPAGERTLLIDDAARLLDVSRRTIYYRIQQGRLRTVRTRNGSQRVLWSSVQALLRERDDEFDLVMPSLDAPAAASGASV
jgi:excisionase family DNA binding protein